MISIAWTFLTSKIGKYVAAVGAALALLAGVYLKGRSDSKQSIQEAEARQLAEDTAKAKEINEKVSGMSDSELDVNLNRWMRDSKK